jgi:hypothetical protein
MLPDMGNMEVSCISNVKVGTFTHLEQSKTSLLIINQMGIVMLTVQHDYTLCQSHVPSRGKFETNISRHALPQTMSYL